MTRDPLGFDVERSGQIAIVTFSNGPANIVDPPLIEALLAELPVVLDDARIRCVVLRGNGRVFIGGADLKVMRQLDPATYRAMRRWVLVQELIERAPKPVVAALNGHALGGGAELALACDLRILRADARFGFPETNLGIFPGAGGSQRLPRLVGPHVAKRLMMDGTALVASEAQALGLVDLVAGDDFEEVVSAEVSRLAARPTATLGLVKEAVHRAYGLPINQAMDLEEELVMRNLELHDAAEGIQAFLDKRPAEFEGR